MFSHLHFHSYYSFLSGTIPTEWLPELAVRFAMPAIALTDTNNVAGAIEFYLATQKINRRREEDGLDKINAILGVELKTTKERAVLLAKSNAGYKEICKTLSEVLEAIPQIKPKLTVEDVLDKKEIEVPEEIPLTESLIPFLQKLTDQVFILSSTPSIIEGIAPTHKENLYIEFIPAEKKLFRQLLNLKEKYQLKGIAAANVYFLPGYMKAIKEQLLDKKLDYDVDEYHLHKILRAINTNTTIGTLPKREHASELQYFMTEEELCKELIEELRKYDRQSLIVELFENSQQIANKCKVEFKVEGLRFGYFEGSRERDLEILRELAYKGLKEKFPDLPKEYLERTEKELEIIDKMKVASCFLVVHDMIEYTKSKGYPYMGRGSAANSLVTFLLDISNVDPIKYSLHFERFLNVERIQQSAAPDFDIDFSWLNRYDVIHYVLNKYGKNRTAMLSTIQTFRDRGAVREVGKAMGYSDSEINYVASHLVSTRYTNPETIEDDLRKLKFPLEWSDIEEWLGLVKSLQGFPKNFSVHAGGVLITDTDIFDYTAVQMAPIGVPITHCDMHSAEAIKLVKLDILATRGIGAFWDTMKMIEERDGVRPPIDKDYYVAFNDEPTKEIIRTGRTKGCFYIESPAMIGLLRKLQTDSFENLTAASSVVRPGVAQSGMMDEFIRRHRDPTRRDYVHPKMGELMKDTYGVMVYQEDVLSVIHEFANVPYAEADSMRRIMSGKLKAREALEKIGEKFLQGCVGNNIKADVALEIWRQVSSFIGFSFCKAHSASYAVLSFQEAWLKVHYPTEFLCSVLNNHGGFYSHQEYVNEAKLLGITVKLPDVNQSRMEHHVPEKGVIQLGLHAIKEVSEASIQNLLKNREEGGPYRSVEEFARRSGVTMEDGKNLLAIGLCDSLEPFRPAARARFIMAIKHKQSKKNNSMEFDFPLQTFSQDLSYLADYTPLYKFRLEKNHLSYAVTDHPIRFLEKYRKGTQTYQDLQHYKASDNATVTVVGYISATKYVRTKNGKSMCLLNISDEFGMMDVVIWPELWKSAYNIVSVASALRIKGKIAETFGVCSVIAETVEKLEYCEEGD